MEKPTVNMRNWELYVYKENYSLSGEADYHPFLGKDTWIAYTTSLVDYIYEDEILIYETRNTVYMCPLKYLSKTPYVNVVSKAKKKLTHRADGSDNPLDLIIAATSKLALENDGEETAFSDDPFLTRIKELQEIGQKEIEEQENRENERLIGIAKKYEDCVYLEVSNVRTGNRLAYHLGEDTGVVKPILHSGMCQDSVLYMKYSEEEDPCALDFRYFPEGFGYAMKTYSWSDNIKIAVIKNECRQDLEFNHKLISPGETMIFTPDSHTEGLFSPDCYNGKTMFSPGDEKEEDGEN